MHKTFSGIFPEALSYPSPHLKDKERLQKCTILRLTIQPILIETSRPDGLHDHSFPAHGDRTYGDQRVPFPPQRCPQTAGHIALIHAVLAGGGSGILVAVQRHEQPLTCKGCLLYTSYFPPSENESGVTFTMPIRQKGAGFNTLPPRRIHLRSLFTLLS